MTLPEPFTAQLERAALRAQSQHANHQHTAVLEAIAEGWGTGHKVWITYCPPNGEAARERVIAPYTLEATDAGVYVIGYDESSNEIRTFKLERLQSARVLPDTYTIPDDFNPDTYLAYCWRIMTGEKPVSVVLLFNADAAPYIRERTWHPSQTIETRADGMLAVRMCIAEPREMLPWIRSWGAQVEVLSPEWLREKVAEELRNAAEIYSR
jgi:predicted DNA-binding transcriptional regulator YafY